MSAAASRASAIAPADARETEVRAAWLYFMEGHTQAQIARRLGVTRLRINRMLADAQKSGLVDISINTELASCVELEQALCRDFGLAAAVIVPTPDDDEHVPAAVGRAAASFVARHLEGNRVRGLGIGWGVTLREMIRHIRHGRYPDLTVCSMMGGVSTGLEFNTFDVSAELARRLRSQCRYLVAPVYASSPRSRDVIMAQPVFRDALARIAACDLAVLSVGDVTRRSMLVRYALPDDVTQAELRAAGAVCDINGQLVDAKGRVIDHPLNRRAIALPLRDLHRISTVVLAAGGRRKLRAIAAALCSGLGSVLVSDETTARAAAALARGDKDIQ
ncbi:MAG TPA: sugar-binding transcriptional regulator [Casimicrobiaceae bacterium]|nr:sugar-binding transcriptional regulator [Casimicrobiaceae bacterium]